MIKVDGDELSGVCFVGFLDLNVLWGYVLVFLFVYFFVGVMFFLVGFVLFFWVRFVLKDDYSKREKIEKLMIWIGVFFILYIFLVILVIGCLFYE